MAKQAKVTMEQAVMETAKEIKLDFVRMCQKRNAIYKREERAMEYCEEVRRQREHKKGMIANAICVGIILVCFVIMIINANNHRTESDTQWKPQSSTYIMHGELQGNHVVLEDGNVHEVDKTNANYTREPMQVTVTLNDNGTDEVDDDIILDIR